MNGNESTPRRSGGEVAAALIGMVMMALPGPFAVFALMALRGPVNDGAAVATAAGYVVPVIAKWTFMPALCGLALIIISGPGRDEITNRQLWAKLLGIILVLIPLSIMAMPTLSIQAHMLAAFMYLPCCFCAMIFLI